MSYCEDSNINKSYIVQNVESSDIFSACTEIYLTNIVPCTGDTINIYSNLNVTGDISGTTFYGDGSQLSGIITTDNYVTGGVYTASTKSLYFTGTTGFTPFSIDVSALLDDTNNYVTGGTYNPSTDTISLFRNDNVTIDITGVTDTFTTGGTYDNGTSLITFVKNDNTSYTVDLSSIDVNDTFVTGSTLNGDSLTIRRNDGVDIVVTGFSQTFTGNTSGTCIGDIYVSNIHSCSPLRVNPNDEGNVYFGSTSGVTIDILNTRIGVGTNNPLETLHVSGNTFIDGGLKVTNVTTGESINNLGIDGSGNVVIGSDTFITGGTYNQDNGVLTLLDNATNSINIDGFFTGVTISNTLFVDENGDDSTGEIGRLDKPFKTLYGAKTASTSGDLIYVLPQTIIYDNRSTAGNQWNGRQNEINLWKDGITYYFSPNTKIIFYNETVSGDRLALFDTNGVSGETCTVLGYLEYEQNCNGPDTSNGHNRFLLSDLGTDGGYTFNVEVKKLTSNHCEVINIVKSNISGSEIVVNIKSEEEELQYLGGQTSSGSFYFIYGVGSDSVVKFNSYSRRRYYNYVSLVNLGYPFYLRNIFSDSSKIDINGYECINLTKPLFRFRNFRNKNTNLNIDKIYYDYNSLSFSNGIITEVFDPGNLSNFILNINGDLIDYSDNSYSNQRLFEITGPNIQINYKGDIYTKTIGGNGRSIVYCTDYPFGNGNSSNNNIKIEGDIHFLGSADTTNVLFQSYRTNSNIEFKGNIYGNYNFLAHPKLGGSVTINNSNISSTSDDFKMLDHTDTTTSTFKLNNTKVDGKNDLGTFSDGQYLNVLINNSSIVNTGSGDTLTNTTNFGRLQVVNSSIYSNSGLSINYPTTSEVITSNLTVNTDYSATTHSGEITKLTDLIY